MFAICRQVSGRPSENETGCKKFNLRNRLAFILQNLLKGAKLKKKHSTTYSIQVKEIPHSSNTHNLYDLTTTMPKRHDPHRG